MAASITALVQGSVGSTRHNPGFGIMTTFVEGGPVIGIWRLEGRPRRKVDGVGHGIVEGAIGLVMTDASTAVTQQGLCSFDGLPLLLHARRVSRNPVDL